MMGAQRISQKGTTAKILVIEEVGGIIAAAGISSPAKVSYERFEVFTVCLFSQLIPHALLSSTYVILV